MKKSVYILTSTAVSVVTSVITGVIFIPIAVKERGYVGGVGGEFILIIIAGLSVFYLMGQAVKSYSKKGSYNGQAVVTKEGIKVREILRESNGAKPVVYKF